MIFAGLLAAAIVNWTDAAPVPGQCTAPAKENVGRAGCYTSSQITLDKPPPTPWWHIYEFESATGAAAAARAQRWSTTTESHGRHWLYILNPKKDLLPGGEKRASIGPLPTPNDRAIEARFMESIFTPGMRTRVHSHSGVEAFYVVEGEQCVESPTARAKLGPGDTFMVAPGPHVQAAARGRKNLTLVLSSPGAPWMRLEPDWTPSQFCAD